MNFVRKILGGVEDFVSGFFLTITIVIVVMNVVLRYGFNSGLYWVEEAATACFVWSVFIGASGCYRRNMHIGIDMIKDLFPEKVKEVINLITNILLLILNGYITYISVNFILASEGKTTPVIGMPASFISSALFVGFGLMTLHTIIFIINDIKILTGKKDNIQQV